MLSDYFPQVIVDLIKDYNKFVGKQERCEIYDTDHSIYGIQKLFIINPTFDKTLEHSDSSNPKTVLGYNMYGLKLYTLTHEEPRDPRTHGLDDEGKKWKFTCEYTLNMNRRRQKHKTCNSGYLCVALLDKKEYVTHSSIGVMLGSWDNNIYIYNVKIDNKLEKSIDIKLVKTLSGHKGWVKCILLLPDGRVVSGSHDNTLKVWNPMTNQCEKTLMGHTDRIETVSLVHIDDSKNIVEKTNKNDQKFLIVSGSHDSTIKCWDPETGLCVKTVCVYDNSPYYRSENKFWIESKRYRIRCMIVLSDGRIMCSTSNNQDTEYELKIWNLNTGHPDLDLSKGPDAHKKCIKILAALSKERIISGSNDGTIKIWDPKNGNCIHTLIDKSSYYCFVNTLNGTCSKPEYRLKPITNINVLSDGEIISCMDQGSSMTVWY